MRLHGRVAARLAGPAVLVVALAVPAGAAASTGFHDRVFSGPVARASKLRASAASKSFRTPDGIAVEVAVSATVANPDVVAQQIVTFLGTRVHGLELGKLRVFIGIPAEISDACGGGSEVLACYSAGEHRMYIPDRDPSGGAASGFTRDYAITHEYGHHIANYRSNSPFPALNFGAKYWSSYELVCAGTDAGRYFPGNQGEHYLDDPGEGFADS
jgi:predicted metalloprotease